MTIGQTRIMVARPSPVQAPSEAICRPNSGDGAKNRASSRSPGRPRNGLAARSLLAVGTTNPAYAAAPRNASMMGCRVSCLSLSAA